MILINNAVFYDDGLIGIVRDIPEVTRSMPAILMNFSFHNSFFFISNVKKINARFYLKISLKL